MDIGYIIYRIKQIFNGEIDYIDDIPYKTEPPVDYEEVEDQSSTGLWDFITGRK